MSSCLRSIRNNLAILLLFAVFLWLMHPGLFQGVTGGYIGGARGDAAIYIYLERINAARFFTWPSIGFDLPSFYPYRRALAYSDNFLLPGLVAKLMYLFIESEPLVYNLIILAALILNGVAMFALARCATQSIPAAIFAGFTFMSCPYFAFHRGHPQLQFGFWIPLALLTTLRFFERRTAWRASCIGAVVVGAFFSAVYYAMYCYLLAGVSLAIMCLIRFRTVRPRDGLMLALGNLPWLIVLIPAIRPYLEVRNSLGTNPLSILKMHSPPLSGFIAAPALADLWSPLTQHLSRMEGYLFFGFVPLLFAFGMAFRHVVSCCREIGAGGASKTIRWSGWVIFAVVLMGIARGTYFAAHPGGRTLHHLAWIQSEVCWIVLAALLLIAWCRRRQGRSELIDEPDLVGLILILVVFFVFATLGIKDSGAGTSRAPELYRFLINLPGFNSLRGLSRMGIVANMLAILLAALAIARLRCYHWASAPVRFNSVVFALVSLTAVELHTRREVVAPEIPQPEVYKHLATLDPDVAVVAVPIESSAGNGRSFMIWNSLYALWTSEYPNRIVNGFSGKLPHFQSISAHLLDTFPSRKSLSVLGTLVGVHYVVTNPRFYGEQKARIAKKAADKLPEQIKTIACGAKHSCLFEVHPIIATSDLPSTDLMLPAAAVDRILSFEVKTESTEPGSSVSIQCAVSSRGHLLRNSDVGRIAPGSDWQHVEVVVPPSTEQVLPVVVTVRAAENLPLLIKNVEIRQAPQDDLAKEPAQS